MEKLEKKALETRKKISLNVNTGILELVRDFAKLTKSSNTMVIEALLAKGVHPLMNQFKNTWSALASVEKDKSKKENLDRLLKELKRLSEKKEYSALMDA